MQWSSLGRWHLVELLSIVKQIDGGKWYQFPVKFNLIYLLQEVCQRWQLDVAGEGSSEMSNIDGGILLSHNS